MLARISKWGNSLAIRLPKAAVESLRTSAGESVELVIEGDRVVLSAKRPRYTLEELVAQMRPEDAPEVLDDPRQPPIGDELL